MMTGSTGEFTWTGGSDGEYSRTANISLTNNGTNVIADGYRTCTLYVLVTPQTWNGLYLSATDNGSTALHQNRQHNIRSWQDVWN